MKVKKKAVKLIQGASYVVMLPTICIIGGIALGAALGIGAIVMTAQDLMEKERCDD